MFFKKKKPETSRGQTHGVDYKLVRSSRRTLALQIREGELVVRAPFKTPSREIEDWIYDKRTWIHRHLDKSRKKIARKPAFQDGALHPFLGEKYPLRILKGPKTGIDLIAGEIRMTLRGDPTPEKIEKALKAFYVLEGRRFFEDRLDELFPPFGERGHKRPTISLRWMKGRWGSMSTKGAMTLNSKLMKKPPAIIDYVIIHELCHLEHMNHGKGFYKLMDQMLPGWKHLRKQLKGDL